MLAETEGCAVLMRVFAERGYRPLPNVPFDEGGVRCTLDGWDAAARVGFEYLTHAERDHLDLGAHERAELEARMERGELYVLLVDDVSDLSADELAFAAGAFLDEVARRREQAG